MNEMHAAYRLAGAAVRRRFAEQRPEFLEALNRLRKEQVVVYSGQFDRVERVLDCLGIPRVIDADVESLQARILFVNCGGSYSHKLQERLGACVREGAWLVTSDWALGNLVQQVFPGTIRRAPRATDDEVVSVEPGLESLWSDVVVLGADPQWWLEGSSHTIEVMDPEVTIEAASHELLVKYGTPVVAVRFRWGAGTVFHVISHFWHKRSRTPSSRHQASGAEFLRLGMRLSGEGVEQSLREARLKPDGISFAAAQSAVTAAELVAQLCVRAAVPSDAEASVS